VGEEPYRVVLAPAAERELARLQVASGRRIVRALRALALDPRPHDARLLVGRPGERIWRIRVGDFRVLYEIRDRELVVLVVKVGHRRDVYR
jgi:mRNA interferase RelE/StbE